MVQTPVKTILLQQSNTKVFFFVVNKSRGTRYFQNNMTIILPCYTQRASLPVVEDPVLVANLKYRRANYFIFFIYLNLL